MANKIKNWRWLEENNLYRLGKLAGEPAQYEFVDFEKERNEILKRNCETDHPENDTYLDFEKGIIDGNLNNVLKAMDYYVNFILELYVTKSTK